MIVESRFPSAVAGEDYDRYSKAVWRQGERWLSRASFRVARESIGMHEAREILGSAAAYDLGRGLYPHEDRLVSELLQQGWSTLHRCADDAEPEIPSFLVPGPADA
ncbi:MAG: hypothetical protein ACREPM_19215 [Gemmatimonadaceae bacterium]